MRPDIRALARLFIETTGAPCLDEETTARGLAAVFAEQARIAAIPFPSVLRSRRMENGTAHIFRRALVDFGVTREQLASADSSDPWLVRARDAVCAWLRAERVSVSAISALVNRERSRVRAAIARHEARARGVGSVRPAVVATERPALAVVRTRRAVHG